MLHKTQSGRILSVNGKEPDYPLMSSDHLLNTIAFIKRNAKQYAKNNEGKVDWERASNMMSAISSLNGEMASYCADQAVQEYLEHGMSYEQLYEEYCTKVKLEVYEQEARKRGLIDTGSYPHDTDHITPNLEDLD